MMALVILFFSTLGVFAAPTFFIEAGSLLFIYAADVRPAVDEITKSSPGMEVNFVDLPKSTEEAKKYRTTMEKTLSERSFDIGLVTIETFKKISNSESGFLIVGEIALKNDSMACAQGFTFLKKTGATRTKDSVIRVATFSYLQTFISKYPEKFKGAQNLTYRKSKKDLEDLLHKGTVDYIVVNSFERQNGSRYHFFYEEVEKKRLQEAKTLQIDLPCSLLIRKKDGNPYEHRVIASFKEAKELNRRIIPVKPDRQARILKLLSD